MLLSARGAATRDGLMSAMPLPPSRRGVAAYVSSRGVTAGVAVRADGSRRGADAKTSLRGASDSVRGTVERGTIDSDERPDRDGDAEVDGADGIGACRGASMRGTDRGAADGADCGAGADWLLPPLPPGTRDAARCCANAADVVKNVIAKTEMAARIL
jgi:hypothetical protein